MARNMLAHLVLDRLERADGHPELLALLDVGQHHLEERIAGADGLECEPDRGLLERARIPSVEAALPGSPRARSSGTTTRSKRGVVRAGRLASSECAPGSGRPRPPGTTKAPIPSPARAMTTTSVVPRSARTPSLAAVEHPTALDRARRSWSRRPTPSHADGRPAPPSR